MSVRFVFGLAGSGKTHYCLECVREALSARNPTPVYLLVPEQSTAITERALLATGEIPGFVGTRVVSFRRLGHLVAHERGSSNQRLIGPAAMRSLVAAAVDRSRESLRYFPRVADRSGFRSLIERSSHELSRYRVSDRDLERVARNLPKRDSDLSDKLHDLVLMHRNLVQLIPPDCALAEGLLDSLIDGIPNSRLFDGARFWVDGFASFTGQEEQVLLELAKKVERLEIALCLDPSVVDSKGRPDIGGCDSVFQPTEETYFRLRDIFEPAGIPLEEPLFFPQSGQPGRFETSPALAHVGRVWGKTPPPAFPQPVPEIRIVECADRRTEVRAAAAEILRLCRQEGFRFREIAVLVRDLQPYRELIEAEFPPRDIPFFCDVSAPVASHPLLAVMRSAVFGAVTAWEQQPVIGYLKTDLAPVSREEADRLENFALERGITGEGWWKKDIWESSSEEPDGDLAPIRDRALAPLRSLADSLTASGKGSDGMLSVRDFCAAIFRFLEAIGVAGILEEWHRKDSENSHHRAVWEAVLNLLDEWVAGAGDVAFPLRECAAQLEVSLSGLRLGLTLPTLDQVTVGSVEYSRQPEVRAALVLGLNEGIFPAPRREDAILGDDDRRRLADRGIRLGPPGEIVRAREPYLAYIAFTRPSERLWLSYALSEADGSSLFPSPLIQDFRDLFPHLEVEDREAGPVPNSPQEIPTAYDLPVQLIRVLSARPGAKALREDWLPFLDRSLRSPEQGLGWTRAYAGLEYENKASLEGGVVRTLYGETLDGSVSRIESFAACPFQHFARYVLRLEKRRDYRAEPVDLGNLFHRVLRRLFDRLRAEGRNWADLDERKAEGWLREEIDRVAASLRSGLFRSTGALEFRTDQAFAALLRLTRSMVQRDRDSKFHQQDAEVGFGFDESAVPPVLVRVDEAREVRLRGIIDRLDVLNDSDGSESAVLVIDYKTSLTKLDLSAVLHGLEMQLLAYLLAVLEQRRGSRVLSPAGAVYLHVLEPIESGADIDPSEVTSARKARGVLSADWVRNLDASCQSGSSAHFGFFIKKTGDLGNVQKSDTVPSDTLRHLLDHTKRCLADYGKEILGGNVSIQPYLHRNTSPCGYCDYRSVCRFERGSDMYRILKTMTRGEVLDRLEGRDEER